MGPLADLLVLIVRLALEAKLAAVDLQELRPNGDLLALGRGAEVLDVDFEADRRVPLWEMCLHRLDSSAFHQADHRWCRQHAFTAHVLDYQLLVDHRFDLRRQARGQLLARHGESSSPLMS